MVKNTDIFKRHMELGESYAQLAEVYDTTVDRVRGAVSKGWNSDEAVIDLLKDSMNNFKGQEEYRKKQQAIIDKSNDLLAHTRNVLRKEGGYYLAIFASDMHLPYMRMDYFALLLQLIEFYATDIEYFSAFNDVFDFENYGKWETEPHEQKALFTSNIGYLYTMATTIYRAIRRKIPHARLIGLLGNHDIRILQFLRKLDDGYSERRVLEFMQTFYDVGVLQFSNGSKAEPIVQLSDGLKWVHGISASKNDTTVVKNTIAACAGSDLTGDEGILYHTTSGHVHRSFTGTHLGVSHANSGCGCHLNPSYLKHKPNHWQLGIVISEFAGDGRFVQQTPVIFRKKGNALVTSYKGIKFETEYDDTMYFLK